MIKLVGGYFIDADEKCLMLCQEKKAKDKKTGEEKDAVVVKGYYNNVKQCLEAMCKFETRKFIADHDGELKDIVKYIKKLDKTISDLAMKSE